MPTVLTLTPVDSTGSYPGSTFYPSSSTYPGIIGLSLAAASSSALSMFPVAAVLYPSQTTYPDAGAIPGVVALTLTPVS